MAKIPSVDYELCIGCGNCEEVCPQVFKLGDDQKSTVIGPERSDTCNCQEAIDTCPVQAIIWSR